MARLCSCPLSVRWRHVKSSPFALSLGLSNEDVKQTEEATKESQRRWTKGKRVLLLLSSADAMKSGVGKNSSSPSPAPSSSAPCSSTHSCSSASDTSLTASSSTGTRFPTSVVERKSSTARPRLSSARRSQIFHRSFHLPVSFRTSTHRIFCWAFHSGHTLKRCSRV